MKNVNIAALFEPNLDMKTKISMFNGPLIYSVNSVEDYLQNKEYLKYSPLRMLKKDQMKRHAIIVLGNASIYPLSNEKGEFVYNVKNKIKITDRNERIEDGFQLFIIEDDTAKIPAFWNVQTNYSMRRTIIENTLNLGKNDMFIIEMNYDIKNNNEFIIEVSKNPPKGLRKRELEKIVIPWGLVPAFSY